MHVPHFHHCPAAHLRNTDSGLRYRATGCVIQVGSAGQVRSGGARAQAVPSICSPQSMVRCVHGKGDLGQSSWKPLALHASSVNPAPGGTREQKAGLSGQGTDTQSTPSTDRRAQREHEWIKETERERGREGGRERGSDAVTGQGARRPEGRECGSIRVSQV
jgi:hypothetical protein